jgi:hypothetical protein
MTKQTNAYSSVATVKHAELDAAGQTNAAFAYNVLAGKMDPAIVKAAQDCDTVGDSSPLKELMPHLNKNEYTYIRKLSTYEPRSIRAAWERKQATAKRATEPTLSGLLAALKGKRTQSTKSFKTLFVEAYEAAKSDEELSKLMHALYVDATASS